MSTQDLFGLRSRDLDSARAVVEAAFGLALEPRDGSYHGGDYCSKRLENRDEILLQPNDDGDAGGWAEEDYRDFGTLLSVLSPEDGDRYREALARAEGGFVHLERSMTTPSRMLRRVRYINGNEHVNFEKPLDVADAPRGYRAASSP